MQHERRRTDRRDSVQAFSEQIRVIINEELRHHSSLAKNGETKKEWFGRLATPQAAFSLVAAVCSVIVLIFTLGGRAYRLETVGAEALATAKAATDTIARMSGEQVAMRKIIDAQAESLAVSETMHASKADLRGIRDQIARLTTRPELAAALRGDLIPRLNRIEEQLANRPKP